MKEFTKQQVDDIILMRYGTHVTTAQHTAYATYETLGKIFGVSRTRIMQLCQ